MLHWSSAKVVCSSTHVFYVSLWDVSVYCYVSTIDYIDGFKGMQILVGTTTRYLDIYENGSLVLLN